MLSETSQKVYLPFIVKPDGGKSGDWIADVILGQPNFSQITPNEVVSNKLFNPGGVYIDDSVTPNRLYVYDAGNSRVLGLSHLGVCLEGEQVGQPCTTDSDCNNSSCQIDSSRGADLVLGQPSTTSSACNGDSGFQNFPDFPTPNANLLCGMLPDAISIAESGSMVTMATDDNGNLYVPDFFNNRILRYDDPFITDVAADHVWGQPGFEERQCNRGNFVPDNHSLCLAPPVGRGDLKAGVAIDDNKNLWVADTQNNRVLRFSFNSTSGVPSPNADLVLGQVDFWSKAQGTGLHQMMRPASVRVDTNGIVYVADGVLGAGNQGRVLVFEPPLTNGMAATDSLNTVFGEPTGLEISANNSLWVNDSDNRRFLRFANGILQETISGVPARLWGGIGIDRDGNVFTTGWDPQQVLRYSANGHSLSTVAFQAYAYGSFNHLGPRGFGGVLGLEIVADQLVLADASRILFWNHPQALINYAPADGVIGQPDFYTRPKYAPRYGRISSDTNGTLWVLKGYDWNVGVAPEVQAFQTPLKTGDAPYRVIKSPLPLKGGGEFSWGWSVILGGLDAQPGCNCLWLSDEEMHRVFRIRDVYTNPAVDIVLGQESNAGNQCNQGRGRNLPTQDSLCHPGALAFDPNGNLFVADHNLEFDGNLRLLVWESAALPLSPTFALFGIPATRVLGRNDDFTEPNCPPGESLCAPWEPAFDENGIMVVGFNAYLGPRFPLVYQEPLQNPTPVAALQDLHSMPLSAEFDQAGNLFVVDHNRHRVLIYHR